MAKKNEAEQNYPRYKSIDECPCKCKCPPCTVVAEQVISRKPKKNQMVRVVVFCDCLLCGPFAFEREALPEYIAGNLLRSQVFKPARPLGTPKNAEIKNRG